MFEKIKDKFNNMKISGRFSDNITGSKEKMSEIQNQYFSGMLKFDIEEMQRENMRKYLCIAVAILIGILICTLIALTDSEQIKEKNGSLYIRRPAQNEAAKRVVMNMKISSAGESTDRKVELNIKPERYSLEKNDENLETENVSEFQRNVSAQAREIVNELNSDSNSKWLMLPRYTRSKYRIDWELSKENKGVLYVILFGIMAMQYVYFKRFLNAKAVVEDAKSSIANDLPDFVTKTALLLNAGLVLTETIEKILSDYIRQRESGHKSFFYDSLYEIYRRSVSMNTVFTKELIGFAKSSGSKDFNRIANILYENINKGTLLSDKLEDEVDSMWFEKKKNIERAGRLSETKLTFPLSVLLIVLLMITAAPALLVL